MKYPLLFLSLTIALSGCSLFSKHGVTKTPDALSNWVEDRKFVPLSSPSSVELVGRVFDKKLEVPLSDKCFSGTPFQGQSWDLFAATFTTTGNVGFGLELKNIVSVNSTVSSSVTVNVTFSSMDTPGILNTEPIQSSDCVQGDFTFGGVDVVVEVLRSSNVYATVQSAQGGSVSIQVSTAGLAGLSPLEALSATASLNSGTAQTLVGRNLILGYKTQHLSVTRRDKVFTFDKGGQSKRFGDYLVTLDKIYSQGGDAPQAQVSVALPALPTFHSDITLQPGILAYGFKSDNVISYMVPESITLNRLRLHFYELSYRWK